MKLLIVKLFRDHTYIYCIRFAKESRYNTSRKLVVRHGQWGAFGFYLTRLINNSDDIAVIPLLKKTWIQNLLRFYSISLAMGKQWSSFFNKCHPLGNLESLPLS